MEIGEKIAELLYALAEIRIRTGNARIRLMAEAMEVTAMEMDALVQSEVHSRSPNLSFW